MNYKPVGYYLIALFGCSIAAFVFAHTGQWNFAYFYTAWAFIFHRAMTEYLK